MRAGRKAWYDVRISTNEVVVGRKTVGDGDAGSMLGYTYVFFSCDIGDVFCPAVPFMADIFHDIVFKSHELSVNIDRYDSREIGGAKRLKWNSRDGRIFPNQKHLPWEERNAGAGDTKGVIEFVEYVFDRAVPSEKFGAYSREWLDDFIEGTGSSGAKAFRMPLKQHLIDISGGW